LKTPFTDNIRYSLQVGRFMLDDRWKYHAIFGFYISLVCFLLYSLHLASGLTFIPYVLLYLGALVVAYAAVWYLTGRLQLRSLKLPFSVGGNWPDIASKSLLIASIAFVAAHFLYLGYVPVIDGLLEKEYYAVMLIRQSIFEGDVGAIWRYGPNILVKSVFPFLVFYFAFQSRFWFILSLLVGGFYAIALMNKIFIILLILPGFIRLVLELRLVHAVALGILPLVGFTILINVQNPHQRPEFLVEAVDWVLDSGMPEYRKTMEARAGNNLKLVSVPRAADVDKVEVVTNSLYIRIVQVPGLVMTDWFENIPAKLSFGHGCGYRWLVPALDCEYRSYAAAINDLEHPELVEMGIHGTMTSASFMEEYANFGTIGLIISGLVFAFILVLLGRLFGTNWKDNLALNMIPLFLMLEMPLSTVILTGGWFLTIILYLLVAFAAESREKTVHA
tara:strand:- start:241 stop:1581 length:1341 start_codon:yes stop_codon:yes gene_type:complete